MATSSAATSKPRSATSKAPTRPRSPPSPPRTPLASLPTAPSPSASTLTHTSRMPGRSRARFGLCRMPPRAQWRITLHTRRLAVHMRDSGRGVGGVREAIVDILELRRPGETAFSNIRWAWRVERPGWLVCGFTTTLFSTPSFLTIL